MKQDKKFKEVQRASFRFDKKTYEDFRTYCKQEGYSQVKLLEKLMRKFLEENSQNDKSDNR